MKLLVAALLLCGVHVVFSCTCIPGIGHPQNYFCTNDAVFIGRIKKVTKPAEQNEDITYVVKVKRSFKGNVKGDITVTSRNSPAACGITSLEKGMTYLLTAKKEDDSTYSIAQCSSRVIPKKDITGKIKKSYNSKRRKSIPGKDEVNCEKCQIQYCGLNGNCGTVEPPKTTCRYSGDFTKIQCFNKLRCIPSKSGNSCTWSAKNCGTPDNVTIG